MAVAAPALCAGSTAPRTALGLALAATLVLGGCVSAAPPALQSAEIDPSSSFPDDPPVIEAASAGVLPQGTDAGEYALATIVPTLAPRDGNSAMLMDGNVMAFAASPGSAGRITPDRRTVASIPTQPAAQAALEPAPPAQDQNNAQAENDQPAGGLFELLYAKRQQRAANRAQAGKTQSANSSGPVRQAGVAALPGVRSNKQLFSLGSAEGLDRESDPPLLMASAGGFTRLSPLGIATQSERVKVDCFDPQLVHIIKQVERHYGKPAVVTSGFRSAKENRRAGGARNSMHIDCKAADIQIDGVSKWALAKYLRTVPGRGGIGTYCRTRSVHVDVGEQREWHHPCRRKKKRRTS